MGDLVSGVLRYFGEQDQADAQREAAQTAANAQLQAARLAAEEARFRPVGVTTRFGQSQFGYDPSGRVSSASYTLSPELKALQDRVMGMTNFGLTAAEAAPGRYAPLTGAAQGLFNLGAGYLAQTPEQAAAQYMQRQQDLLAPSRERQYAQLQNQIFQTGRGGLAVGGTGLRPGGGVGLKAANPEMEAYYNALAQQDAQLAAQAQEAGQLQTEFGAGLFDTGAGLLGRYTAGLTGAYSPFQTVLGTAQSIEQLGQAPLDIGMAIGGRGSPAASEALLRGGLASAQTGLSPAGLNPAAGLFTNIGTSVGKMLPSLTDLYKQYQQNQTVQQFGAENVYGPGGRGVVPAKVNWDY